MLKKKNRLTKKEFDFVFKNGEKKFSKNFFFLKVENQENWKISTSVSKKIYKKAVKRNESRRLIYRILKENEKKISENYWAVLIITKPILDLEKEKVQKEILWLLKK